MSQYGGPSGPPGSNDPLWLFLKDQPTVAVPIITLAASKLLYSGPCIVAGWSLIEAGGAAAIWDIFDGGDATGQEIGAINFASGGSSVVGPGPDGPYCKVGVFLSRTSGTIRGAIWLKL